MINSRQKGKRGELELARLLTHQGYRCRRGVQYSGGPDSPDVVGLPGIHIECKRAKTVLKKKAMEQAIHDCGKNIPVVMYREDDDEWMVLMREKDWMTIYREWELSHDRTRGRAEAEESPLAEEGD